MDASCLCPLGLSAPHPDALRAAHGQALLELDRGRQRDAARLRVLYNNTSGGGVAASSSEMGRTAAPWRVVAVTKCASPAGIMTVDACERRPPERRAGEEAGFPPRWVSAPAGWRRWVSTAGKAARG